MAWYEIFGIQHQTKHEMTIIDRLNAHLAGMTHNEQVEALKAIVPLVCEGYHLAKNPKGVKRVKKEKP